MRTVEEVRRLRLLELKREFGSYAKLNELMNMTRTDSTFSQVVNRSTNSKGGKPKTMGSDQARELEAASKKPVGWMDTDPDFDARLEISPRAREVALLFDKLPPAEQDRFLVVVDAMQFQSP